MGVLLYLLLALLAFALAIRFYSPYLARTLGEDRDRPTPAVECEDGRDYVPTKTHVLFAHHFSAIAGAGPILGPTAAILYGFVPAWLWVVLGGIFIGAAHDFAALFVSMREGGKSMAEVAHKTFGKTGFILFILFTILMLVLVTASFLSAVSVSLTSLWPLAKLGLTEGQTLLKTEMVNGVPNGRIGGIASTSVVIITLLAPLLGWLIYRRNLANRFAYPLAALICAGSVIAGIYFPIVLSSRSWQILISVYVFFAAGLPVWMVLQPRDFINVQILYAGIVLLVVSLLIAGFTGTAMNMPAFNLAEGTKQLGFIFPIMFVTIACGAISGFHSLVAGGTTGKQLCQERDARRIGFNAMLLESLLAVCVLLAIAVGLQYVDYKSLVFPVDKAVKSNPILAFSLSVGAICKRSLGIPMDLGTIFGILLVEGFVITTLDAAVRFNRYLFEELWGMLFTRPPALLRNYLFNSLLAVLLMWGFSWNNAFTKLWPIFGTANQLLAALGLISITVWLLVKGRKYFFALAPALFMMVTTLASLVILMFQYFRESNRVLMVVAVLLLGLSLGVIMLSLRKAMELKRARKA